MKVTITDYTHHASDSCVNGGNYSFSVLYRQVNDDQFEVLHSTSSEYPYCPLCGSFYQKDCPCGMEGPDVVSWEEVESAIDIANIRRYSNFEDIRVCWEED